MITADQLVCHAIGDYVLQSDWMATEKTRRSLACAAHVISYAAPFLFLHPSTAALAVIVVSHFVIDRWRLARFVCWGKNVVLCPPSWEGERGTATRQGAWSNCKATGYPSERPVWLATWLLIIADNVLHVLANGLALRYLP
jgi:hypothetical protein